MTVSVNLTSIPSRFVHLQSVVDNLRSHPIIDEIHIHIPHVYSNPRFKYEEPPVVNGAKVHVHPEDFGPARRYIHALGDDIIIIVDDDTWYHPDASKVLVKKHRERGPTSIWGGSGFNFSKYFLGDFSKTKNEQVQVVEGYGMIVMSAGVLKKVRNDVLELAHIFPTSDDILMNNLYDKYGFKRFYHAETHWIRQLEYGFGPDALHKQNDGSHMETYKKSLRKLRDIGHMYYEPTVTYGVTVCTEARELQILLEVLTDTMVHADEIVVLADQKKVSREVDEVVASFPIVKYTKAPFDGDFSKFKNRLNDMARGKFIFQIDADEVPTGTLIEKVYIMTHGDLVFIPRVNVILGCTPDTLKLHTFTQNEAGFINWPDYQGRFYRKGLTWGGSVHEKVEGAEKLSQVPPDPKLALWHVKTARKSKDQKEFYESLLKGKSVVTP